MSAFSLPHRLQQVVSHVTTAPRSQVTIPSEDLALLTPPMEHQFRLLNAADQRHLLAVAHWLRENSADADTITAGLIHDVGKACAKCRITVLDRGLHVILTRCAGPLYRRFAAIEIAPAPVRGLHRLANHTERSALAAEQAGYNQRVVELIRHHESRSRSNDPEMAMLRRADREAKPV